MANRLEIAVDVSRGEVGGAIFVDRLVVDRWTADLLSIEFITKPLLLLYFTHDMSEI